MCYLLNKERMLPSPSSFRNPACKFPRTGLAPQEPASRRRVPLVHVFHSPPETIQVTSGVSIGIDHIAYSSNHANLRHMGYYSPLRGYISRPL